MRKTIELPILPECVVTTELDKHLDEGWKIVSVSQDMQKSVLRVRLEKEE